jgi:glucan phosphorylase
MNPVSEKDTAVSVLNIIKSLANYQPVTFQAKTNGLTTGQLKDLFRHINKE